MRRVIRLLLLEDDALLAESLIDLFESEQYECDHSLNAKDALELCFDLKYDLYIFDIKVPYMSGVDLLKEIRDADDFTPAIMLTSYSDKVTESFHAGADDYIKKPFDPEELLLRIKALLRRSGKSEKITLGAVELDSIHKSVYKEGERLEATLKEFELLTLFAHHKNAVVTKEMIKNALWSSSEEVSEGAIRVYINRIKQIVGTEAIENVRGIGYRLVFQN